MEPNKPIVTVYTISMDEFSNIFPWFESLSEPKPPKKRGRKPKANQMKDEAIHQHPSI
jgi:hypothetical protein